MIIYLSGPDSYRREERVKELVGLYNKKHPQHDKGHFSLEDQEDVTRLRTFLGSQSLFTTDKLGIIDSIEIEDRSLPKLLGVAAKGKETTLILSLSKKLTKPYAAIEKESALKESFEIVKGKEFLEFTKKEAVKRNIKLSEVEMQSLLTRYEGNTWGLITTLETISLGGTITEPFLAPAFFPALQKLAHGSIKERVPLLTSLLETTEPAAIFNILASLVSGPLKTKMADYDIAIKSGKLEYEEALTDFVIT